MAASKFTKPAAKTPGTKKKVSRYAGIKASAPRDPMPVVGTYRFKWLSCEEGFNPGKGSSSFKVHLEVVSIDAGGEDHVAGQTVFFVQGISGKGQDAGLGRVKAAVMATAGFEDEDEFDAFAGEEGEFLEAVTGEANEYSTDGQPLIGRLVDCQVTRGNARDDGDYYREFAWAVVADEDGQEIPRCGE
jgi:hypothetical protein